MEATIGGTRRHLADVAAGQAERGLAVRVVASAERMPAVRGDFERLRAAGVEVRELPMVREIRPGTDWAHGRALCADLRAWRPDVVHTHSSKAGVLGRLASLRTGIGARVHTPHTFAFLFSAMFSPLKRRFFRGVERTLAARTHRLIAVSESEAATIRASGVVAPERVRVVPNAVDPARWRGAEALARAELELPEEALVLAVIGLLNRAKGQDVALRALAETPARDVHLALVGHGEDLDSLRALAAELGVERRVRFLGWRDDPERVLAAADGLLLPSRWEGMPYAVLEAMAAARPVVAAAVDGARDLVVEGETGFLARIEDPVDLARAMGRLATQTPDERRRMGEQGAARQALRYAPTAMFNALEEVYREALEAAR